MALVINTFYDQIVGWKMSQSQLMDFVPHSLEQALHSQKISTGEQVDHSDRGSQSVSVAYTERLTDAGIQLSVGNATVDGSYDLAETINGLYKSEVHNCGPWKTVQALELATPHWVNWHNHERLMKQLGYRSPVDYERLYYLSEQQYRCTA